MAIKLPESARKVLQDKAYGHVVTFGAPGRLRRGIGGAVVDHHHFVHDPMGNSREERPNDIRLVQCWNDERGLHEGLSI